MKTNVSNHQYEKLSLSMVSLTPSHQSTQEPPWDSKLSTGSSRVWSYPMLVLLLWWLKWYKWSWSTLIYPTCAFQSQASKPGTQPQQTGQGTAALSLWIRISGTLGGWSCHVADRQIDLNANQVAERPLSKPWCVVRVALWDPNHLNSVWILIVVLLSRLLLVRWCSRVNKNLTKKDKTSWGKWLDKAIRAEKRSGSPFILWAVPFHFSFFHALKGFHGVLSFWSSPQSLTLFCSDACFSHKEEKHLRLFFWDFACHLWNEALDPTPGGPVIMIACSELLLPKLWGNLPNSNQNTSAISVGKENDILKVNLCLKTQGHFATSFAVLVPPHWMLKAFVFRCQLAVRFLSFRLSRFLIGFTWNPKPCLNINFQVQSYPDDCDHLSFFQLPCYNSSWTLPFRTPFLVCFANIQKGGCCTFPKIDENWTFYPLSIHFQPLQGLVTPERTTGLNFCKGCCHRGWSQQQILEQLPTRDVPSTSFNFENCW